MSCVWNYQKKGKRRTIYPRRLGGLHHGIDRDPGDHDLDLDLRQEGAVHRHSSGSWSHRWKGSGTVSYTHLPLGYVKDPDKKGHLLIDPETRWIIEKIFDLAVHVH